MDTQLPSTLDEQMKLQAAATVATSTNETALDMGDGFAPAGGGLPMMAVVPITSLKTSATDEIYVLAIQDSPDNATFTTRQTQTVTAAGTLGVGAFIKQRYVRMAWTLGGTSPSIVVGDSYLSPEVLG